MKVLATYNDIELSINDVRCDLLDRSTVENAPPELGPLTFESTFEVESEAITDWLDGFEKPEPPTMNFSHRHHGGLLTTTMQVLETTSRERAQLDGLLFGRAEIEFNGRAMRMRFQRDGAVIAWDPSAVDVGFCVEVGGEP